METGKGWTERIEWGVIASVMNILNSSWSSTASKRGAR